MELTVDIPLMWGDFLTTVNHVAGRSEVPTARYKRRLNPEETEALDSFTRAFDSVLRKEGRDGVLIAVGGSVHRRPLPRKDLDLLVMFDGREVPGSYDHWVTFYNLISKTSRGLKGGVGLLNYPPYVNYSGFHSLGRMEIATGNVTLDIFRAGRQYDSGWREYHGLHTPYSVLAERTKS